MLGGLGIAPSTAGDVIAGWLRDTGDAGRVLDAIQRAAERRPRSLIPYITACLERRNEPAHDRRRASVPAGSADRPITRNPFLQLLIETCEGQDEHASTHAVVNPWALALDAPALSFADM